VVLIAIGMFACFMLESECTFVFYFSVDVWSVGCIMAELLTGKPLFPGNDRIFYYIIPVFICQISE